MVIIRDIGSFDSKKDISLKSRYALQPFYTFVFLLTYFKYKRTVTELFLYGSVCFQGYVLKATTLTIVPSKMINTPNITWWPLILEYTWDTWIYWSLFPYLEFVIRSRLIDVQCWVVLGIFLYCFLCIRYTKFK